MAQQFDDSVRSDKINYQNSRERSDMQWVRLFLALLLFNGVAVAAPRSIDAANSTIIVRVYKAGVFSALGHDHEIAAPIASGKVEDSTRTVELRVDSAAL